MSTHLQWPGNAEHKAPYQRRCLHPPSANRFGYARQVSRKVSAPVRSPVRDGIIACKDISMEEAWAKCAVKTKRKTSTASNVNDLVAIPDVRSTFSTIFTANEVRANAERKLRSVSEQHTKLHAGDLSIRERPPDFSLDRNDSCVSKSSYASNSSWVSSARTSRSQSSQHSQVSTYYSFGIEHCTTKSNTSDAFHHRNKSTEVIMPSPCHIRPINVKAEDDDDKAYLQTQLGRPTDSDDSPYAICSQYRLRPRLCLEHDETKDQLPKKTRQGLLKDFRQSLMWIIGKTNGTSKAGAAAAIAVPEQVKDLGIAHSRDSKVSVSSVYYSDDEAGKLWKSLEKTLGINLDCEGSKAKQIVKPLKSSNTALASSKELPDSRIPRLRTDYRAPASTLEQRRIGQDGVASRLPVPKTTVAKLCWEPKEKRDSGVDLRTQHHSSCRGSFGDVKATSRTGHAITITTKLSLSERLRLDDAMKQQCCKGASLRLAC